MRSSVEHQVEQRTDLVGMLDVRRLGGIEHRQQCLGEPAGGPIDLRGEMRRGALAVVVEVGLQALGDVLELVALAGQLVDLGVDRRRQSLVVAHRGRGRRVVARPSPELLGDVGTGIELDPRRPSRRSQIVAGLLAHAWVFGSLSSSTTSASTISSSFTDPAPDGPAWPDADVPAALASRAAAS